MEKKKKKTELDQQNKRPTELKDTLFPQTAECN